MQVFRRELRKARVKLGITQVEAARRIGVSESFYGRMERGRALPNVGTLSRISCELRVRADVLIGTVWRRTRSRRRR